MIEKDYTLSLVIGVKRARISKADDFSPLPTIRYGTKIFNQKTKSIGLLIYTWQNKFADWILDYAICVDRNGKRYNIELDNIQPFEDFE